MFQFSLRTLLVAAVIVAIGCAALIHPTEVWRQAVVSMTVLILLVSTLAAIFGQGSLRVSACGFAVAGSLYFLLAFAPAFNVREHLLTTHSLETLEKGIHHETQPSLNNLSIPWNGSQLVTGTGDSTIRLWDVTGRNGNFHSIGHALWTLIFGVIGMSMARWFCQRPTPLSSGKGQTSSS